MRKDCPQGDCPIYMSFSGVMCILRGKRKVGMKKKKSNCNSKNLKMKMEKWKDDKSK